MNPSQPNQTEPLAWCNGSELPGRDLALPFWDLGVVAGAAVSEMARTYGHRMYLPDRHIERLLESCGELGFTCRFTGAALRAAAEGLVAANTRQLPAGEDLGVVWFVTAGVNQTYLGPDARTAAGTVAIHTFRLPFELWETAAADGVRLRVPTIRQIGSQCLPIHRKTRNRLHWWLADREAAAAEAGARALLLDEQDCVTETSTAAFFGIHRGVVVTPDQHVLESLSCRMVEEACGDLNIPFRRRPIPRDQLAELEAAFVSSTPSGVFTVAAIDGVSRPPTTVVDRLLGWWRDRTGIDPRGQILKVASSGNPDG